MSTPIDTIYAKNGQVGIGTNSTDSKLHIHEDTTVALELTGKSGGNGTDTNGNAQAYFHGSPYGLRVMTMNNSTNYYAAHISGGGSAIGLFVRSDNSVGIGTDNPVNKLHVNGGVTVGATNGAHLVMQTNEINSTGGLYLQYPSNSGNLILCNGGGNVGIGTNTIQNKLHVNGGATIENNLVCNNGIRSTNNTTTNLELTGTSGPNSGGSYSAQAYFHGASYGIKVRTNNENSNYVGCFVGSTSKGLTVYGNGNATINGYLLVTRHSRNSDYKNYYIGTGSHVNDIYVNSSTTGMDYSIKSSYFVLALGFGVPSDERIKENIQEVPDDISLQKLRDIQCKYYEYKDKVSRGTNKTIGFIAQQVKEHIPLAVSIDKGILPNEMRLIETPQWTEINDGSDNKFKLTISDLEDVSGNKKYKFYVSNDISGNDETQKEINSLEDEPNSFIFDQSWNNVFLYGKEVDDFHTLDKQKLFALNFSATQEIDRIQQQQLLDISGNSLAIGINKNELELLKLENQELTNKVTSLETELNNLKTLVESLVNNN